MESKSIAMILLTSTLLMFISSPFGISLEPAGGENSLRKLHLPHAFGGEDAEFDPKSNVFYTGVADGRILKFVNGTFVDFATTSPHRGNPSIFRSGDTTGKLFKYEATTGEVTVVLDGLSGPAGMAMSNDQTFLI
ncbi:hypothetical protein DM860_010030 [Cuscuta australis]|uniref:Strictosidine synthase conserved region domain-containing protein n=1 Tax=Cuscuta australis TaxID=267555 RepID=A0A328D6Q9_9ASTE|nr:hypothetical protein DM860_010030 [Cuscuta australis]